MILFEKLSKLMDRHTHPGKVLDLWAWEWRYSIFCASYGDKVTAVDNESKKNWLWPNYLLNHPNINFIKWDIRELPYDILDNVYNVIIIFNVITFLDKGKFINHRLPKYVDLLYSEWVLCLSFFFPDDETMSKNKLLSFYSFEDFYWNTNYTITNKDEFFIEENHEPVGLHTHHIWYLEIKKN